MPWGVKGVASHKVLRELQPRYRKTCLEEFGGVERHNVIIALGLLDDLAMFCMSAAQQQRKEDVRRKKEALGTWVPDEDLPSPGASASSRGPVKGIQHHKTKEKKREKLNWLRNKVEDMDRQWERGQFNKDDTNKYFNFVDEIERLAPEVGVFYFCFLFLFFYFGFVCLIVFYFHLPSKSAFPSPQLAGGLRGGSGGCPLHELAKAAVQRAALRRAEHGCDGVGALCRAHRAAPSGEA